MSWLWASGTRISDFGFTPNRGAALGENVVLLVNLGGSALLYVRFLRGGSPSHACATGRLPNLYVLAA